MEKRRTTYSDIQHLPEAIELEKERRKKEKNSHVSREKSPKRATPLLVVLDDDNKQ